MNVYRGCVHGCIYCDSRSSCYHTPVPFEDIEVKENAVELLRKALYSKRRKCMIGTGSMSDPYIPLEEELKITRGCLEVIKNNGFGATLITKSDLVLRDMDLLEEINRKAKAVLQMTLTTADPDLCRILEPGVCNTQRRFEVLMEAKRRGIPTVVWLTPILPFINDNMENIGQLLNYCKEAGVKGIIQFGTGMTLREGNREYFYSRLDQYFPGLKERYVLTFGESYELASPDSHNLTRVIEEFCRRNEIMYKPDEVFAYLQEFPQEQPQLFDF